MCVFAYIYVSRCNRSSFVCVYHFLSLLLSIFTEVTSSSSNICTKFCINPMHCLFLLKMHCFENISSVLHGVHILYEIN